MRFSTELEKYRYRNGPYGSDPGDDFGAFRLMGPQGRELMIIASPGTLETGINWEHVSVSARKYCPTWREMCFVKDLFWGPEETVMQLHPPQSKWINNHPTCLHLWRPKDQEIPLPPDIAVGDKALGELDEHGQKRVSSA